MASKRDLKKQIHYVCGETALTCIFTRNFMKVNNVKNIDKLIVEIAKLQQHALQHINFSFEKTPQDFENKAAYKKALHKYRKMAYSALVKEFNGKVHEIVKQLNAEIPNEQRDANRNAATGKSE